MTRANREIIEAFAQEFDPPLTICMTSNINRRPVKDAWLASYWDKERRIGITAHAVKGRLHAFLECEGDGAVAEPLGQMMARALKKASP